MQTLYCRPNQSTCLLVLTSTCILNITTSFIQSLQWYIRFNQSTCLLLFRLPSPHNHFETLKVSSICSYLGLTNQHVCCRIDIKSTLWWLRVISPDKLHHVINFWIFFHLLSYNTIYTWRKVLSYILICMNEKCVWVMYNFFPSQLRYSNLL